MNTVFIDCDDYRFAIHDFVDDITEAHVFQVLSFTNGRRCPSCVTILVYKDSHNIVIQDVQYFSSCSCNKILQNKLGTAAMIKTALRYIIDKYRCNSTWTVSLADNTYVPGKTPCSLITAKRLLTGEKGWYEEYVGAIPTGETEGLIKTTRNLLAKDEFNDIADLINKNKYNKYSRPFNTAWCKVRWFFCINYMADQTRHNTSIPTYKSCQNRWGHCIKKNS